MFLVAIHHVPSPGQPEMARLAKALECSVHEARQRLVATPSVVRRVPDQAKAEALKERLAAEGIAGFLVHPQTEPCIADAVEVRRFAFEADGLRVWDRYDDTRAVSGSDIVLIVRGHETWRAVSETTVKKKKLNAALAVATGGLVSRTSTTKTTRDVQETLAGFVHVYTQHGGALRFEEMALDFRGLDEALEPSRVRNMMRLLERLRATAPRAVFDERLMRRAGQSQLLGPQLPPESHLPEASAVLAVALRTPR